MKVLLDEMLPAGVAGLLPGHDVTTVQQAGFTGLGNGALLRRAVERGYDVLLTADRNLPAQQNITVSGIALVLVSGSRMREVRADGNRAIHRVLFAPEGRRGLVLLALAAFTKKTPKTPPDLIALAEQRLTDWRSRGR